MSLATASLEACRVASWNVMRDDLHERSPHTRWKNRYSRIIKTIQNMKPDMIGLQEARDLGNDTINSTLEVLKSDPDCTLDYNVHFDTHGNNKKLLKLVNMWNRNKFERKHSETLWLSLQPYSSKPCTTWNQHPARPIAIDVLRSKKTGSSVLFINTHVGHNELEKYSSLLLLTQLIPQVCQRLNVFHFVLVGDFNIDDSPTNLRWKETICHMLGAYDSAYHAITELNGYHDNRTFVGSSVDPWSIPLGQIGPRFDHIFVSCDMPILKVSKVWDRTELDEEPPYLQNLDVFPSDHLAIISFVGLPSYT